jgi:hypothetical protein
VVGTNGGLMKPEYWHVKYHERFEDVYEWTCKEVCIARHPSEWIKCKREVDNGICKMTGYTRILWEIVHAVPITKEDYDSFILEN